MPDTPWRALLRWLQLWNRPHTSDLPPPVASVTEDEREQRESRIKWVNSVREHYDQEVNERVTRLEVLAETLRQVARKHSGDTEQHPITRRR